jgi:hypothetical protein
MAACGVAFEHASGLQSLAEAGLGAPASALLRVQFEALTRAMWLLYAATDSEVQALLCPLTVETAKAANKLPMVTNMLLALKTAAPEAAIQQLLQFKDASAGPLNSFIHSGIHPIQRKHQGFPAVLLEQIVRSSNALNTMSGMVAAILTGNPDSISKIKALQNQFKAVLPALA